MRTIYDQRKPAEIARAVVLVNRNTPFYLHNDKVTRKLPDGRKQEGCSLKLSLRNENMHRWDNWSNYLLTTTVSALELHGYQVHVVTTAFNRRRVHVFNAHE